ncbi:hypothetical protein L2Y94_14850 [Luteibacter aegosomatis]|uniref:hypothetical protein n=1 Tax=Luteibacter aegosomatis TaxID=2911537 RepID=UPI001FFAA842|nr:hypothetical protein [Luteibacter aegosomatis]UPG84599.1 hypothetical protein L2Y94_14850 [Luteibacter aegosomatis]
MPNDRTNTIGAMAAGRLLIQATGGRWGPVLAVLAGIVLVRRILAGKAQRRLRHDRERD